MAESPALSSGENVDSKSGDRKNATWSFSTKNNSPNKVFTVDEGGNKKLWLYKENIFEISEEPAQSTRQKLGSRHSGGEKLYNDNAITGMQRNSFGPPSFDPGELHQGANQAGHVTFETKESHDLYRSSSLVNISNWRESCRDKVRVRAPPTFNYNTSLPPNNLSEFQRDRLSRRFDRSPVSTNTFSTIGVPSNFPPQLFNGGGGEFDRMDRQYASIQPRRSAPHFSASEFNPASTTSWGRRNAAPHLGHFYSPVNTDMFQYRSVFPYTTLHYPTRKQLYKRSGSASTKHGKAHQFQHVTNQRGYLHSGTFDNPKGHSGAANYHSVRSGSAGKRGTLMVPRRPTSYPCLPPASPHQQPPPPLQLYDIFDDSVAPTSTALSPYFHHSNHHQQQLQNNPNFTLPVTNLNTYTSNSSQTLNPPIGNMELPAIPGTLGRFGGALVENSLSPSYPTTLHHRQLMSLPSEMSSGYSDDGMCQRRCIIGWVIGLTALIIVALAIALFIQVSKDAAVSRKQRMQLLDDYYGGAEEIKL